MNSARNLVLAFSLLFVLPEMTFAMSIFDVYRSSFVQEKEEEKVSSKNESFHAVASEAIETLTEISLTVANKKDQQQIDALRDSWKLSKNHCFSLEKKEEYEYCTDQLFSQKIEIAERRLILERRKKWNLSLDFCHNRTTYKNYEYCQNQLHEQQNNCSFQKTSGKQIIVDINNQVLYGLKDCELKIYTRVTTGKNPTPTPTGSFSVYEERGPHFMQGEWFVNKALYYYRGYAIHDADWRQSPYWLPQNRAVHGSHGCTNVPSNMMEKIWEEFGTGTKVTNYYTLPTDIAVELKQKMGNRLPYDPERDANSFLASP